ncbi:MAG TPA: ABC transporter permease subunit [Stellaceae bacterium]|jgi:general L-amino acid transport system permease protein|nr:ABC transporter permease subunit [Stellaceae bacterium]
MALRRSDGAWWNDERYRRLLFQVLIIGVVGAILFYLGSNAVANLRRQGIVGGFGFVTHEAGFEISPTLVAYSPADSYARALLVGLLNTLLVAAIGIVFASLLGLVVGLARLSRNWLVGRLALAYVELMRNTPLVLQLFVWWNLLKISAPGPRQAWEVLPGIFVSNRGVALPVPSYAPAHGWCLLALALGLACSLLLARWARRRRALTGKGFPTTRIGLALTFLPPAMLFLALGAPFSLDMPQLGTFNFSGGITVSPEFSALVVGLVVYTAAFIGEIVRSGVEAVSRGQSEAARALGLRGAQVLRLVVLPQAVRVIIPPLTSEYLNLAKNSTLAVTIGFFDYFSVANTMLNQTGQTIEAMALIAAVYLSLSLGLSLLMNLYNRRMALVER